MLAPKGVDQALGWCREIALSGGRIERGPHHNDPYYTRRSGSLNVGWEAGGLPRGERAVGLAAAGVENGRKPKGRRKS